MIKPIDHTLYVIAPISNPVRFHSRYRLYRDFAKHVTDSGAALYTVEAAYGRRDFEVTERGNPNHIQVRTPHELWLKENLINIGISRLPRCWRYVAWVDADIQFARPDWVQETLHQLQHHPFVQMWSHAQDLGPCHEPLDSHVGFAYCHLSGMAFPTAKASAAQFGGGGMAKAAGEGDGADGYYYTTPAPHPTMKTGPGIPPLGGRLHLWHPGYAWAARRDAIDHVGGLIDWAILGAADMHMAKCLVGRGMTSAAPGIHENYLKRLAAWQERCERHIRRDVGCVNGLINHYWHGKKVNRRYWDRWKILVDNGFDPEADLKLDWQGVLQLVDEGTLRSIGLRDGIRGYFRSRSEDSIDV